MPQSLSASYIHVVFATKDREPFLLDLNLRTNLHAYIAETSTRLKCPTLIVGGVADHVHALVRWDRTVTQADWVKEVKRVSSIWMKSGDVGVQGFGWQGGYGVFTVGSADIRMVHNYIRNQEEHHRKFSFKEEYLRLLTEHGLEWDERYVWD